MEPKGVASSIEIPPDKKYLITAIYDEECARIKEFLERKAQENVKFGNDDGSVAFALTNDIVMDIGRSFNTVNAHSTWDEAEIRSFNAFIEAVPKEKEIKVYKWLRNIAICLELAVFVSIMFLEELSVTILIPAVILAFGAYLVGDGAALIAATKKRFTDNMVKGILALSGGAICVIAMTMVRVIKSNSSSLAVAITTFVIALFVAVFEFMYKYDVLKASFLMNKIFHTQRLYAVREHFNLLKTDHWHKKYQGAVARKVAFLQQFPDSQP